MIEYLALTCDPSGQVDEVLRATGDVVLAPGASLYALVDPGSHSELDGFLAAIASTGHAFGWQINVREGSVRVRLHFAGARIDGHLVVLASTTAVDALGLVEAMSQINNEQSNALRQAHKELSRAPAPDLDVLNEMSQLNNELATVQRELARRNARLEQLRRERNELLGMVAHDLRSPLAVTIGVAEHLLREAPAQPPSHYIEMLEHVRTSSERMLVLVEELLDLATFEAGTLTLALAATDLPALVTQTVRLTRELARAKGVTIELEVESPPPAGPCSVVLDAHKITQALTNLLTNAVKFSHPGGVVTVRLGSGDGEVTIAVSDNGVGIPEAQIPRLFEPFHAGRPGTRGERTTGLGLAIVRRIVRGHGGTITVASAPERGATFTLTLPLDRHRAAGPAEAPAAIADLPAPAAIADLPASPGIADRAAPAAIAPAPASTRTLDILIADDDPVSSELLSYVLEARGHRVIAVEDAGAAIDALAGRRVDLLIVDLEMPGGGGRRVAEVLRESAAAGPRIPIVALTGHSPARAVERAGPLFDGVLTKPTDPAALESLLARLTRSS